MPFPFSKCEDIWLSVWNHNAQVLIEILKNRGEKSPPNGILQLKLNNTKRIKLIWLQNLSSDPICQNLNSEPWIPKKFIYICTKLHIRGCILLCSSNWNQWKLNKWEMTQERAPGDTKSQGFSEVQCMGSKETGVNKTLKGFSIQCEKLFWKLSPDSSDRHSRCRVLLPIRLIQLSFCRASH